MAEYSMFWDGSTIGDCGPYGQAQLVDDFMRYLLNGELNRGVLKGWLFELEVYDAGGLDAAVHPGGAIVYGGFYESDVATNVAIPNNSTVYVVVRRDWGTQTIRLAQVAAIVQNVGVQFDIPLAEVTTVAGAITLITDLREFCTFSTIPGTATVEADHLQADSVTIGKLINQTRWVSRGGGEPYPDVTVPATRDDYGGGYADYPQSDTWIFSHGVVEGMWLTFRVPADFTGATMSIYYWLQSRRLGGANVRLAFSAWVAAPAGVLANQTGAATHAIKSNGWLSGTTRICDRNLIGTIPVAAGNIVHLKAYRDGTAGTDTDTSDCGILMVEASYTADS